MLLRVGRALFSLINCCFSSAYYDNDDNKQPADKDCDAARHVVRCCSSCSYAVRADTVRFRGLEGGGGGGGERGRR